MDAVHPFLSVSIAIDAGDLGVVRARAVATSRRIGGLGRLCRGPLIDVRGRAHVSACDALGARRRRQRDQHGGKGEGEAHGVVRANDPDLVGVVATLPLSSAVDNAGPMHPALGRGRAPARAASSPGCRFRKRGPGGERNQGRKPSSFQHLEGAGEPETDWWTRGPRPPRADATLDTRQHAAALAYGVSCGAATTDRAVLSNQAFNATASPCLKSDRSDRGEIAPSNPRHGHLRRRLVRVSDASEMIRPAPGRVSGLSDAGRKSPAVTATSHGHGMAAVT